jgi:hypothetical protein
MRVATALTGIGTCAAGFLPAAAAHAAAYSQPGKPATTKSANVKQVRLDMVSGHGAVAPDATPSSSYWLDVWFKNSVTSYQVCGWHPINTWRCTTWDHNFVGEITSKIKSASHIGGNIRSWVRGQIDIRWNGGGPGRNDTCNTNSAFYGNPSPSHVYILYGPGGVGIGNGVPEC